MDLAVTEHVFLHVTELKGTNSLGVNYTRVQSLLAQQGGGFVFYRYPNPAHNMTPESKMSYVAPVDDTWYLGAGIY